MRVRGLKHIISRTGQITKYVAPHAGAWIETKAVTDEVLAVCRTPCGCVD